MKKNYPARIGQGLLMPILFASSMIVKSQTAASQPFNFTSNGAVQTFTVPFGVTSITVEAWGGGGGGAGAATTNGRAGGGGGAYSRTTLATTSGTTYSLVVGQGGVGTSNPGGAGGSSSFYTAPSTIHVLAAGGGGGNGNTGGAGGTVAASTGTTRFAGGAGGTGITTGSGGGGGGSAGAGGAGGNGGNGSAGTGAGGIGGAAGATAAGLNPGAIGGTGGTRSNTNATVGTVPGAGGGGRSSNVISVNRNGAAGANGRVVVNYVINYIDLSVTKTSSNSSPFAGDAVTFTINAKNNNLTLAASNVILTDVLPSGYTFISSNQPGYNSSTGVWTIGSLAANTTVTLTITAIVNDSGIYNNTATISSDTMPDDVSTNNSATASVTVCKGGSTAPQVKQ